MQKTFRSFIKKRKNVAFFWKEWVPNPVFYNERAEWWIAISSFVLGIKRGKAWWKEHIWSESLLKGASHSFIKSELLPSLFT